ncbi:hypothetical protein BC830DRAFT_625124 [Chytriomyces sp. MP71]|nr:hypothetical protein BC830DRAFT_625124 [Chytriomyces sp. MP71]
MPNSPLDRGRHRKPAVSFKQMISRANAGDEQAALTLAHFHSQNGHGAESVRFFVLARDNAAKAAFRSSAGRGGGGQREAASIAIARLFRFGCGQSLDASAEEARKWMRRAATEDGHVDAWMTLGDWLMEEAESMAEGTNSVQDSDSDKGEDDENSLAPMSRKQRKIGKALKAWQAGVKENHLGCVHRLAAYLVKKSDFNSAIRVYEVGAKLDDPESIKMLAKVHSMMVAEVAEAGHIVAVARGGSGGVMLGGTDSTVRVLKKQKKDQPGLKTSDSQDEINCWSPSQIVSAYLKHARRAASNNDTESMLSLASTAYSGLQAEASKLLLLPQDHTTSLHLYLQASETGAHPQSLYAAARLLFEGSDSLARDVQGALDLFLAAARVGVGAFEAVGDLWFHGVEGSGGVAKDLERAVAVFQEGCDKEEGACFAKLGDCYRFGYGCVKDSSHAIALYETGYKQHGNVPAIERFAYCLTFGEGCRKDIARAR